MELYIEKYKKYCLKMDGGEISFADILEHFKTIAKFDNINNISEFLTNNADTQKYMGIINQMRKNVKKREQLNSWIIDVKQYVETVKKNKKVFSRDNIVKYVAILTSLEKKPEADAKKKADAEASSPNYICKYNIDGEIYCQMNIENQDIEKIKAMGENRDIIVENTFVLGTKRKYKIIKKPDGKIYVVLLGDMERELIITDEK